MKYLLDSDVIINHFRLKARLQETIVKSGASISIITHAELMYEAYKSIYKQKSLEILNEFLQSFHIEIIPLNEEIIVTYADIKTSLEEKGQKLDEFDLLIAATAKISQLTLVTHNLKHFSRVPQLEIFKN